MLIFYLLLISSFVSGMGLLHTLPQLPPFWPFLILGLCAYGLSYWRFNQVFLLLTAVIAGFCWTDWRAQRRIADRLDPALEQQLIEAEGFITDLPQTTRFGTRFLFIPEHAGQRLPEKIQLQWYGPADRVKAGERWRLFIKLRQVHGVSNPGGFDLESWFLQQNIGATGTVRSGRLLPGQRAWLHRLRARLREHISQALPDAPYRGVIIALTIGDQGAIAPAQWQRFAATGVTHLISISGLHITLLAALAAGICNWIWRRIPWLATRFAAQRAALITGILTALCYCLLAGLAVPTQRTLFMLSVAALCLWRALPAASSAIWAAALLVTVVADPFSVLSVGFWLSYLTVGALLWAGGNKIGQEAPWKIWVNTQAAATLASAPLLLVVFGQLPLVSPLANAFAIPLVSILITPLALAGLADPTGYLLFAAERLFAATDYLLQWCAALPTVTFNMPAKLALIPAAFGILLLLLPRGIPGRSLGLICCLPLLIMPAGDIPQGQYRATVLDVDQGLAVLIETTGHRLLFDTGQLPNGEHVLLPAFRSKGIRRLDALILSHGDNDHIGAAAPLLSQMLVSKVWHGLPDDYPWPAAHQVKERCKAGQSWIWDGVTFTLLWPDPLYQASNDNARSCVLRVDNGRHSILIPADISTREEARLVEQGLGQTNIVLAPHHGSKSASSMALVSQTSPRYAVFSAGYLNRFGHPKAEVTARYRGVNAENLYTDASGALIFDVGDDIRLTRWRDKQARYWHTVIRHESDQP